MDFARINGLFKLLLALCTVLCTLGCPSAFADNPFQLDIVNHSSNMMYFHTADHRHFSLMPHDHFWAKTLPIGSLQYGYFDVENKVLIQIDTPQHFNHQKQLWIKCVDDSKTNRPTCQFSGT